MFSQLEIYDIEKLGSPVSREINTHVANCYYKGSYEIYKKYVQGIYDLPPISLRDLVGFKEKNSISLDEVEPVEEILKDLEVEACLMERYQKKLMKH